MVLLIACIANGVREVYMLAIRLSDEIGPSGLAGETNRQNKEQFCSCRKQYWRIWRHGGLLSFNETAARVTVVMKQCIRLKDVRKSLGLDD